ncbi:hybrid sensor histidine kinase/response regulator [Leisingera sp. ANG-Vp]|uniref:hybrid sensor histidine kinase/response regulator n=1 Tax=Leisingera sp. ANG-Vp TaxID=1577896 RepID=UPI00057CF299|nr:PAS domain-containing hybrid sensor histidine kinase/response regulator [Leisingera sp. ANG-Vp]KIC19953.1 histidine kinase [Leisingera sp. ANG-Vp]
METADRSGTGPLAGYYRKYGSLELLLRYARGRVRLFWGRQLFMGLAFAVLGLVVPPLYAVAAFAASLAGDAVDCLVLRRADALIRGGMSEGRLRLLTSLTAFLHGLSLCAAASAPFWVEMPSLMAHTHNEPLFTIGLLAGAAINAGLVLPYHPQAVITKLLTYAALPVGFLAVEIIETPVLAPMYNLHLTGLAVLYASYGWFLAFVMRNFARTRSNVLAQALQQQELEGAYARLSEQQMEAKRLALVAENASDSVMLMDREGRITWVNDSFTRLTGYTSDEALGRMPGDLLNSGQTDPATIRQLQDCIRYARQVRVEICNRRKDGQHIWIETSQVPMLDSNGKLETLIAVERDISAAKEHAKQLEEARIAAEEGARAKADFLATMSHEIRTPMNGVIGMAQLLRDSGLNEEQELYAGAILSSADTLLALINDVLDFSKMDAGEVTLSQASFDPRACFTETVQLLQAEAKAKGLELMLSIADNVPGELHGDDRRIRQILMNLAGNAIKFTDKGQVKIALDAESAAAGHDLVFSVTDTGIGIAEDKLDAVFDRFSQADAAISRRFGGTGLGLAISRRLAEAMGGGITVVSEMGQGSCFTVRLRLQLPKVKPDDCAGAAAATDPPLGSTPAMGGLRVLVAEDNAVNRVLLEKFLQSAPVELAFAENGLEAVAQFETFAPDIILMDMSMPEMDGLEATRVIRGLAGPQPAIVALTANAFDSDREACLAAGMDDFMSKPVNRGKLLDLLGSLAPQAQSRRAG